MLDWVYDWISAVLPTYEVYRAKQSETIPTTPACVYQVISHEQASYPHISAGELYEDPLEDPPPDVEDGTFDRTYQYNDHLTLQIDVYSDTAYADIKKLCETTSFDAVRDIFLDSHVAVESIGTINDWTFLGDVGYYTRYSVRIVFAIAETQTEQRSAILRIIARGDVGDMDRVIEVEVN